MAGRRLVDNVMDDDDDDDDIDFEDFFGSDSEISGPPPLANEFINAIPVTTVTQDQVNDKLQCTVCKQEFTINECVKQLKCQHIYHEACIRPWLELHSTCPICRQSLSPAGDYYNATEEHRNRLTTFLNSMIQNMHERRQRRRRNQAIISFSAPSLVMEAEPMSTTEITASSSSSSSSISSTDTQHTVDMPTIDICSSNEEDDPSNMSSIRIVNLHPPSTTTDTTSSDSD